MKTILTLFFLAFCLTLMGQTVTLLVPLGAPFLNSVNPTTNRAVKVQVLNVPTVSSASVIIQDIGVLYSDPVTGILTVNNAHVDQIFRFTVLAPPAQTVFEVYIPSGSTGTVNATNTLSAAATATFPAGSVAWSAATSDARYAAFGSAGSSNFTTTTNYGTIFDEAGHRIAFQTGVLVPDANNTYDLGAPGQEFGALYAGSALIPGRVNSSAAPGGFAYFTGVFATSPTAGNLAVIGTDSGITNGVAGTGLTYNNTTRTLATNGNGLGTSATFNQMPLTNVANPNLAAGLTFIPYNDTTGAWGQIVGTNVCTLVLGAVYLYTPLSTTTSSEFLIIGADTESPNVIIPNGVNENLPTLFTNTFGSTKGIFLSVVFTNHEAIQDTLYAQPSALNGNWSGIFDSNSLYNSGAAMLASNNTFSGLNVWTNNPQIIQPKVIYTSNSAITITHNSVVISGPSGMWDSWKHGDNLFAGSGNSDQYSYVGKLTATTAQFFPAGLTAEAGQTGWQYSPVALQITDINGGDFGFNVDPGGLFSMADASGSGASPPMFQYTSPHIALAGGGVLDMVGFGNLYGPAATMIGGNQGYGATRMHALFVSHMAPQVSLGVLSNGMTDVEYGITNFNAGSGGGSVFIHGLSGASDNFQLSYATASRVAIIDASTNLTNSSITTTTLGYLDATSSIQTQLNAKAPLASPTFTGKTTSPIFVATVITNASPGSAVVIDATLCGKYFITNVTANFTISVSNMVDGQDLSVTVFNDSSHSITSWGASGTTSTIIKQGGVNPPVTPSQKDSYSLQMLGTGTELFQSPNMK